MTIAIGTVIICTISLFASQSAQAAPAAYNYVALKSGAIQSNGENWLELRNTFSAMDMNIAWKADGQSKIKIFNQKSAYEMTISEKDKTICLADGTAYPYKIIKGTTYVPFRFFQQVINREVGLSGTQMMVLLDNNPNWKKVNGTWINQNPMWTQLNTYQKAAPVTNPAPKTVSKSTPVSSITNDTAETGNRSNNTFDPRMADGTPVKARPACVDKNSPMYHNSMYNTGEKLIWPSSSKYVSSPYGERIYPIGKETLKDFHMGIDIAGKQGNSIMAAAAGKVIRAEVFYSYGNCVDIQHPSGLITRYAHLDKINVEVGQSVKQGEIIGLEGMTGAATGPHLHFETRVNGYAVDPEIYLHYR